MNTSDVAQSLSDLFELQKEPLALAFCAEKPDGIKSFDGDSPSSCGFWVLAESETFFASAEKHYNCPVGAAIMGFDLPKGVQEDLDNVIQKMCGSGYLDSDEAACLPSASSAAAGIVYGLLKNFPIQPDTVLLWLTASQAMIFNETVGACHWTEDLGSLTLARPACALIPMVLKDSPNLLSFGCIGMRTFTNIDTKYMLGGIAYHNMESFLEELKKTIHANKEMLEYYRQHNDLFPL